MSARQARLAAPVEVRTPARPTIPRRRFLGYVIAAPTVGAGARIGLDLLARPAAAAVPSGPGLADIVDLTDVLTDAAMPTANLIYVVVNTDGTASFALPRAEVGQGITTAVAMTIADEMDLAVDHVHVTLADARPELVWNQLTGGSNSLHSIFTPVRVAAAIARGQLFQAAALQLGVAVSTLTAHDGLISAPDGRTLSYGSLTSAAAAQQTQSVAVELKSDFSIVGTPQPRVDALDIVTGRKQFAMDLDVPGALPTMMCRPPTINGTVVFVHNIDAVKAMPGITDVAVVPTGVAVRGATFGQCIDAVDALVVTWGGGTEDAKSDADVAAELARAELPFTVPSLPLLTKTIDETFTFYFAANSPLETNCAVADVRPNSAEVWSSMKSPIIAQQTVAAALGLPAASVTCDVAQGGGSFGRHLFFDAALEAALISQKMAKPVKLMWHRTDDFRQGRMHPMCRARIRASYLGTSVLAYEYRHTSGSTDFTHGLGELLTATVAQAPVGDLGFAQTVYALSQNVPYNFGVTDVLLNEVRHGLQHGEHAQRLQPDGIRNICRCGTYFRIREAIKSAAASM